MDLLTQEQIADLKEEFAQYSKGRGYVTLKEFGEYLEKVDKPMPEAELIAIVGGEYKSKMGIGLGDFLAIIAKRIREADTEDELINAFKMFDKEGNNLITVDQLRECLKDDLKEEEIEEFIQMFHLKENVPIDYEDFVRRMMSY